MCTHTPLQCSFFWYIMLICTSCGMRFFDTRWCSNTCVSHSHSQRESPAPCPPSACVSFFDCRWHHYTSITGSRVSSRCFADTLSNALKHAMEHIHANGHVHRTSDMRSVYMHSGQLRWCIFVKILLACVSHLSSGIVASFLLPRCILFVWSTFLFRMLFGQHQLTPRLISWHLFRRPLPLVGFKRFHPWFLIYIVRELHIFMVFILFIALGL